MTSSSSSTYLHKILALECTHQCISVAAATPEGVVEETVREWQRTAESIVPLVSRVLEKSGSSLSDIDFLALSSGPGSFTALRIGMATAKGIAYGAGFPLVTVSTMEAMALAAKPHSRAVNLVPVIPARKGELYYAIYRSGDCGVEEVEKTTFVPVADLMQRLEEHGGQCVVVARDITLPGKLQMMAGLDFLQADFFSASSLLPIAQKRFMAGDRAVLETVTPDYQQKFRPGK